MSLRTRLLPFPHSLCLRPPSPFLQSAQTLASGPKLLRELLSCFPPHSRSSEFPLSLRVKTPYFFLGRSSPFFIRGLSYHPMYPAESVAGLAFPPPLPSKGPFRGGRCRVFFFRSTQKIGFFFYFLTISSVERPAAGLVFFPFFFSPFLVRALLPIVLRPC